MQGSACTRPFVPAKWWDSLSNEAAWKVQIPGLCKCDGILWNKQTERARVDDSNVLKKMVRLFSVFHFIEKYTNIRRTTMYAIWEHDALQQIEENSKRNPHA